MQDTNVAAFTARLTRDPELRSTPGGTSVCDMRVAIGRRPRRGKDGGAAFVDVRAWGVTAENCARYLAKGRHISVAARIEHDEWEHKGKNHQRVYFVADQVLFLDGSPERSSDAAEPDAPEAHAEPAAAAA